MIQITNVIGSLESSAPLIIGKDTVYVHTNVVEVSTDDTALYQYDETQYTLDEWEALRNRVADDVIVNNLPDYI